MTVKTIKSVQPNGSQETPRGILYKFEYEFTDGTTIDARHKSENAPFGEGQDVLVNVKGENAMGKYGSVSAVGDVPPMRKQGGGGGGRGPEVERRIMAQWAIREAQVYLANSGCPPDSMTLYTVGMIAEQMLKMAEDLPVWMAEERQKNGKL